MAEYRFLGNAQISLDALRATRREVMLATLPADRALVCIHDVTQLDYTRHRTKADRELIGDHDGLGYEYIPCLAVDELTGEMRGVLHDTLVSAAGPDDQRVVEYDYEPLFAAFTPEERRRLLANHCHQQAAQLRLLATQLRGRPAVQVADREFDDYFLLDQCLETGVDFVIRSKGRRNVQMPETDWIPATARTARQGGLPAPAGWGYVRLDAVVKATPLEPYKTLPLDARGRVCDPAQAQRFAALQIGAFRLRLYRLAKRNHRYFPPPRPVEVNVVVIRETAPPPGVEPLLWILLTSLPVDTPAQRARIGRLYELRWKIEEFFRLLKSGYGIEKRRLQDATKIGKLLVILTLAAVTAAQLRSRLGLPAGGRLPEADYRRLTQAQREPNNRQLPLDLRLFAYLLRLGGWIGRRQDPIGPLVLMRGLLRLGEIFAALDKITPLLQEAREHPEALQVFFCV